ncbi:putative DNA-binding transcriptional regulator YafY [Natronospira proteinivora]|uniref:DNA-binding transcriptional regulator YafY n=1 Tax=Natronospira proteinivora TaxID=1807133 RepID=A0ABT1GBB6_9GAMM|nr:WYL domain-containing protein [Natronospira proteinivora]MCP1727638.1 putative DNA-binding transcriptional regulator YafY [Natronospira proteinivora]
MAETTVRYVRMLELVPGWPRKSSAQEILDRLESEGLTTSLRTVQRDLEKLSGYFPLTHDEGTPRGWQWAQGAQGIELPAMSPATALSFLMLNEFSRPLLPNNIRAFLDQHLDRARGILTEINDQNPGLSEWSDLVTVAPRSQPLIPPTGDEDTVRTAYDALLYRKRFEASYHSASRDKRQQFTINPLGVVLRDNILYLICTLFEYEDIRILAMHRLEKASLTEEDAWWPAGFDLKDYVASGAPDILAGPEIRLVADFNREAARHLEETPLSKDQTLEAIDQEETRVTATVQNTKQLRWWLMGFGPAVEVIEPKDLREEMAANARALLERYQD